MDSEAIVTVSAAVVAAVQLVKWAGLRAERGPLAVVGLSLIGVALWAISTVVAFDRALIWPLFSAWIAVSTGAAGVFGFVRAAPEAVSSFTRPPGQGAGSSPVATGPDLGPFAYPALTPADREALVELVARVGPRRAALLLDREARLNAGGRSDEYEGADEGPERRD